MKLTEGLKRWLIENAGVEKDADDDELRKAAGGALADGTLSAEKFIELTTDKDAKQASAFEQKLDAVVDVVRDLAKSIKARQGQKAQEPAKDKSKDDPSAVKAVQKALSNDSQDPKTDVRVKGAWERYSTVKGALHYPERTKAGRPHPLAGQPVRDFSEAGRAIDTPSELDRAIAGAYAKFLCATAQRGGSRTFGYQALPDHDKELLQYAMREYEWAGSSDGSDYADIKNRTLTPSEQKALIDDSTSGGFEAAPIVFDDQVIQTPLLHGELFPLVTQVPLDRGRRVEGVAVSTVTGSWGGVDNTAISLFNTANFVTAFDTTIFRWEGAIRIGLDFLSDTPIDFGALITAQYGERLLEDLDDVIAAGNGTNQPEGVINKSGVTSVSFGGATSIGNYESLRFGVAKSEHRPNVINSAVFCGTETSYQRVMALPVGSSDARRLFGTGTVGGTNSYDGYSIMGRPYKINESLTNAQIFYAILARYRMYRRRGLTMRTSTEGDTLIRANELLMVATARYGGQLERGAAAAVTTTAPA